MEPGRRKFGTMIVRAFLQVYTREKRVKFSVTYVIYAYIRTLIRGSKAEHPSLVNYEQNDH